jgi:hypothetical protein
MVKEGTKGYNPTAVKEEEEKRYVNGEWDDLGGSWIGFLRKWTFEVTAPMIKQGLSSPLQFEDLMHLSEADRATGLVENLAEHFQETPGASPAGVPRLVLALISAYWFDIGCVMLPLTFFEGFCRIGLAMTLRFLLEYMQYAAEDGNYTPVYLLAATLGFTTVVLTVVHHVLFFFSMRLGWRWKLSTTGLIYRKLFELKSSGGITTETVRPVNSFKNPPTHLTPTTLPTTLHYAGQADQSSVE